MEGRRHGHAGASHEGPLSYKNDTEIYKLSSNDVYGYRLELDITDNQLDITNIKKKEIKEIKSINVDENKINCLIYNSKKDEIIIGNDKGIIILWNNSSDYIFCDF